MSTARIGESGLTLVEVLVVVTLIGLVASVAGPTLGSGNAADQTVDDIRAALSLGSSEAARLGVEVDVEVDMEGGLVRIEGPDAKLDVSRSLIPAPGSGGRIRFLPVGRAGGDTILVGDDAASGVVRIFVRPWSGRVVVERS